MFIQIVDIGNFIMRMDNLKVPLHLLVKWGGGGGGFSKS